MTEKKFKVIYVQWIDISESKNGWSSLDELEDFITNTKGNIVNQVGFLFEEDEESISILNSYFPNEDLYGVCNVIPKGCIIERKFLEI